MLNDHVRKKLAGLLPAGEQVHATVALRTLLWTGAISGGVDNSCLRHPYCAGLGLDLASPAFRTDLVDTFLTATDRRLVFHKPNPWGVRPAPRDQVGEEALGTVELRWLDDEALAHDRLVHLVFPDGRSLLQVTPRRAGARYGKVLDEPDLLVQAFGARAVPISA